MQPHCAVGMHRLPQKLNAKVEVKMKKLLIYMKKFRKECILAPLFKLLEATFELFVPLIVAAIIDNGIDGKSKSFIINMGLLLLALAAVGLLCSVTAQFFAAKAAIGFCTDLRAALLKKIQSFSYTVLDTLGVSGLITRMTSDINQIQTGVNLSLRLLLRSPFVVFGAMIMAFTIDTRCALIFAGVIVLLCAVVFSIMLASIPKYRKVQAELDSVTGTVRENLVGVRVLRAFCREEEQIRTFDRRSERLLGLQINAGKLSALMNPLTLIIINAAVIILLQSGAIRVDSGSLTQGQVVALYNLMAQILVELIKMANLFITITKSLACADRVAAVMQLDSGANGGNKLPANGSPCGSVEFKNVSFEYKNAGAEALFDISFFAKPGQTVGIIGGTGSGKSTLVNLVPNFYSATKGQVLIDGVNADEYDRAALLSAVSVVPQKAVLFEGTIRSNLLMGNPNASEAELFSALETAQAAEIVRTKPNGIDEPVLRGGSNFSGGQKQRLSIARALVHGGRILILDDSASALDFATDAKLRAAIRKLSPAPTTFIVSQRAASVMFADFIIVLDEGRAVGQGTHEELLRNCAVYREIYASQFPDEAAKLSIPNNTPEGDAAK